MSLKRILLTCILIFGYFSCTSTPVFAAGFQQEYGGGLHYYSGLEDKSLAPNTGTMLRFGASNVPKGIYKWVTSMTLISGSATATFKDSGTSTSLAYSLLGGEFNFGAALVPMATNTKLPIQPYLGVAVSLQINSIQFTGTTTAQFPKTDATMFMGYALFVGTDLVITKGFGLGFHVEQSIISGQVASTAFVMSGNRVFLNVFFR